MCMTCVILLHMTMHGRFFFAFLKFEFSSMEFHPKCQFANVTATSNHVARPPGVMHECDDKAATNDLHDACVNSDPLTGWHSTSCFTLHFSPPASVWPVSVIGPVIDIPVLLLEKILLHNPCHFHGFQCFLCGFACNCCFECAHLGH